MKLIIKFIVLHLLAVMSVPAANDLTPIGPNDIEGYYATVRKVLLGTGRAVDECWMISRPSFSPEFAVYLDIDDGGSVIKTAGAEEQIYHSELSANGKQYQLVLRTDVDVARRERSISHVLADRIRKLWIQAVKRARYPAEYELGCDGTTYEFHAPYDYYGETWSPGDGIAAAMVDLGGTLFAFARKEKEPPTEKNIAAKLDKLEAELAAASRS